MLHAVEQVLQNLQARALSAEPPGITNLAQHRDRPCQEVLPQSGCHHSALPGKHIMLRNLWSRKPLNSEGSDVCEHVHLTAFSIGTEDVGSSCMHSSDTSLPPPPLAFAALLEL